VIGANLGGIFFTNKNWRLIWEAETKNGGPCLGHSRASPNAVGEEATPLEFTFFEAPVYDPPRLAVHISAVLSGDKRSPISPSLFGENIQRRMLEFGMPSESPTCGPVATRRMQVSNTSARRGSYKPNKIVYWNQKTKSQKQQIFKAAALAPLLSPL
jgi:hypothetical protein